MNGIFILTLEILLLNSIRFKVYGGFKIEAIKREFSAVREVSR